MSASGLPPLDRDMTGASDEQLLKVVGLIDTLDRRGHVDRLLEPVRARLALLRPPRPITLGRVLILPFEDLLVADEDVWPGRRCFARGRLALLIEQVAAALPPATLARLRAQGEGRSMMAGEAVREIGATLWPAAAEVAELQLAGGAPDAELREQLAAVTPLLALGPSLVPTIWQLPPRPMGPLARGLFERLVATVRGAAPRGENALQSVLELMLTRAAAPTVVLEPLRGADLGIPSRARDEALAQLVRRRIADMREAARRLPQRAGGAGSGAAILLRLVGDLDALENRWSVAAEDRAVLQEIRTGVAAFVGTGIDHAAGEDILVRLGTLANPGGLDDAGVERLEETARHTRRLGIAGAKLGLAATADAMLERFLPTFQAAIRDRSPGGRAGLLDQVRIVEILFGADAALQLYDELRGRRPQPAQR
jgi:hypothetical protein